MDYLSTIKWMFGKLPMYQNVGGKAYKKDLKNIFLISEYLNNPHKNIISVQFYFMTCLPNVRAI